MFSKIFIALIFAINLFSQKLEIHFFDVHSGNACLIISPGNEAMIVDFDTSSGYVASKKAKNILDSKGITKLKYTIASHGDSDHCAGFDEIIGTGTGKFDVTNANFYNGVWSQYPSDYQSAVLNTTAKTQTITTNHILTLAGGVTIKCISVNGYVKGRGYTSPGSDNGSSIGIILSYNNFDIWLGGDTTIRIENEIVNSSLSSNELDVDVYLANHHGDNDGNGLDDDGNSQSFINRLKPEVAIISAGSSGFDNPNLNTINYLINAGAYIYQTAYDSGQADIPSQNGIIFNQDVETTGDYDGDIKIETDGSTYYSVVGTVTPSGTYISNNYTIGAGIGNISFTPSVLTNTGLHKVKVQVEVTISTESISNIYLNWKSIGGITNQALTFSHSNNGKNYYIFTNISTISQGNKFYPLSVVVITTDNKTLRKDKNLYVVEDIYPPLAKDFRTKFSNNYIKLSWQNPSEIDYKGFIIRYNTNPYDFVQFTNQGNPIYSSTNKSINTYLWELPSNGYYMKYYFTIFFIDLKGNYSKLFSDIIVIPTSSEEPIKIVDNFIKPDEEQKIQFIFNNSLLNRNSEIKIYNIKGELIRKIIVNSSNIDPSNNSISWDLKTEDNKEVSSGLYFIVINTGEKTKKEKVLIVR